jgi:hypothetical protein
MLARERERERFAPYWGQPFDDPAERAWSTPQQIGPDLPSPANVGAQPQSGKKCPTQSRFDLSGLSAQVRPFNQARHPHGQTKNKGLMILDRNDWTNNHSLRQGHSVQNLRFSVSLPSPCVPGNRSRRLMPGPTTFKPVGLKPV